MPIEHEEKKGKTRMQEMQKKPQINLEEQQDAAEYLKTWSDKNSQTLRTTRFFRRTQNHHVATYAPQTTDLLSDQDLVLPLRHLRWNGTRIDDHTPARTAEFEIREILGGGGMGSVYSAVQKSVDREVALKMISPDLVDNNGCRESFLREAVVTGNLTHPNIVSVHDLGKSPDGSLFYTMQKICGISWDKVIRQKKVDENLEILSKVCDAIAYAHNRGVIHRDLKPSNIMLGDYGEVMVTDWGVAAGAGDTDLSKKAMQLTSDSDIEGTPAYMPPEMLDDNCLRIGPCSDIYLIGAILYEIVAGKPPHKIRKDNMIHAIRYNIIQPTEQTGELIDIAYKAMSTKPEDRYPSVKVMQQELRSYQIHRESIRLAQTAEENFETACITGDYQLFADAMFGFRQSTNLWPENKRAIHGLKKLIRNYAELAFHNGDYDLALSILDRNNPKHQPMITNIHKARRARDSRKRRMGILYFSLVAMLVLLVMVLTIATLWVNKARSKALAEESRAKGLLGQLEQENYYNMIALAANQLRLSNNDSALKSLENAVPDFRSLEWQLLYNIASPLLQDYKGHNDSVSSLAIAVDGNRVYSGSRDGSLQCRSLVDGKLLATMNLPGPVQQVRLSPDNRHMIIVCPDRQTSLVDFETGKTLPIKSPDGNVSAADFSADSQKAYFATQNGSLFSYDLKSDLPGSVIKAHDNAVSAVIAIPDSNLVATAGWDHLIRIWDIKRGIALHTLKGHDNFINALAVSPDGKNLVSGGGDNRLCIWKLSSGEKTLTLNGFSSAIDSVAFSPDGNQLLVCHGNNIDMISRNNGRCIKTYECGKGVNIYCAAFTPDGKRIISGDGNNRIRVWDAECILDGNPSRTTAGNVLGRLLCRNAGSGSALYAREGNRLILQETPGAPSIELGTHDGRINSATFIPSAALAATCADDTNIKLWNLKDKRLVRVLKGHKKYVNSVTASDDGRKLLSAGWDGLVIIWDRISGRQLQQINVSEVPVTYAAFSPDMRYIVTADSDGQLITWSVNTGLKETSFNGHTAQVNCAVFSPDGKRIISSSDDGSTKIWDARNGREILSFTTGNTPYTRIDFEQKNMTLTALSPATERCWKLYDN